MSENLPFKFRKKIAAHVLLNPAYTFKLNRLEACDTVVCNLCQRPNGEWFLQDWPTYETKLGASCLVQPHVGDRVSAVHDQGVFYITHILFRRQSQLTLEVGHRHQALHIVASSLTLESTLETHIATPQLSLVTRSTHWVSNLFHQVVETLSLHAKTSHTEVTEQASSVAKHMSLQASQSLSLRARIVNLKADGLLKVDGTQVHMN